MRARDFTNYPLRVITPNYAKLKQMANIDLTSVNEIINELIDKHIAKFEKKHPGILK